MGFLVLFFLFFGAQQSLAVGFGQVFLHSHLGEPLAVRVPLLLANREKIGEFDIHLATPKEYYRLEQIVPTVYPMIRVNLDSTVNPPEIRISSLQAIDETILTLVLKVQRGRGSFYKKIQFFLDAADIQPVKQTAWGKPNQQVQYTAPSAGAQTTYLSPVSNGDFDGGWARRNNYGPVQRGDSLSEISYRLRKDKRYSNRQVMLLLFETNPGAFNNNNINELKKGAYLKVPSDEGVQQFIGSKRYRELKNKRLPSVKPQKKKLPTTKEVVSHPRFQSKISLGLTGNINDVPINPVVLRRLDSFEPMYQQAMATGLRMDDMGGKVDIIAEEVKLLHHKIDALARSTHGVANDETSYGWLGFIGLFLLNVLLVAAYLYRKQMKAWQEKLSEARYYRSHKKEDETTLKQDVATSSVPSFNPILVTDDPMRDDETENDGAPTLADKSVDKDEPQLGGLDEYDSLVGSDISRSDDEHELSVISMDSTPNLNAEDSFIDSVNMFEEMVQKKDWRQAEKYYKMMTDTEQEKPRMQALWVQVLHGSHRVTERNITLLNLSKLYEYDQWHRFCTYCDHNMWHEMQADKVISFTGSVVESEMNKMNEMLVRQEENNTTVDLIKNDEVTESDLSKEAERYDVMKSITLAPSAMQVLEFDDELIDMGRVDDVETNNVGDRFSGDITNEDGDTVLMSPKQMDKFRKYLDK